MKKSELRYLVKAAAYNVHRKNLLKQNIKAACIARDLRKEDLKGAILAYMSGDKSAAGVGKFIGGWVGRAGTALANHGFARSGAAFGNAANLLNTGLRNTGRVMAGAVGNAARAGWQGVKMRAGKVWNGVTHPVESTRGFWGRRGEGFATEGSGIRGWIDNFTGRNQRNFMQNVEGRTFKDMAAAGKENMSMVLDTPALRGEDRAIMQGIQSGRSAFPQGYTTAAPRIVGAFENQARRLQMATNKARVQAGVVGTGLLATGAGIYQAGSGYNPTTNSLQYGYTA